MAIDTAAKRNSALLDPGNLPWPPDGTIAVGDRLVMLEFYSGIAAATPAGETTIAVARLTIAVAGARPRIARAVSRLTIARATPR